MIDDAFFFGARDVSSHGIWIDRGRIDIKAMAGLQQVANDQSDHQRQGGNALKIEQGLDADTTDLLEVSH